MDINRSFSSSWVLLAIVLLFVSCGKNNQQSKNRPNIVYIMGDDFTWQAIGSYASYMDHDNFLKSVTHTPHIDKLRSQGSLLTNVFCTNSICAPSRATIMTGQYSSQNGVYTLSDTLDPGHENVAKDLHSHGYQTAIFGKWHLKARPTGFDYYDVSPGQGKYHNPPLSDSSNWPDGKVYKGFSGHVIANQAIKWLKQRDPDKPFMIMIDFKATHEPFDYPQRFDTLYQGMHMPEPKSLYDFYPNHTTHKFKWQVLDIVGSRFIKYPKRYHAQNFSLKGLNKHQRREKIYQHFIKIFLRSGASLDYNVGRILNFLKNNHLVKNTVTIYTSDQGYFVGEYGTDDKRVMYDPALRMPFIIRYPKEIRAGSILNDMILNIDFAPTLLDYAGVKVPKVMQGRSFRANLRGHTPDNWRTAMYYRYWMHQQHRSAHFGIRTQNYMLMFLYGQNIFHTYGNELPTKPTWEFYDLKKDPLERHDDFNNPKYQTVIKNLKKRLLKLKRQAGDTVMIKTHTLMQKIMSRNFKMFNMDSIRSY
jgi:arylsulfatase A-like enzyme